MKSPPWRRPRGSIHAGRSLFDGRPARRSRLDQSSHPAVRAALLAYQRAFARRKPGAVLDGRDIGTVICPDAECEAVRHRGP